MSVTSIIDPRFLDGSATNEIPVFNSTTGLFTPTSTLSGLTSVSATTLTDTVATLTGGTISGLVAIDGGFALTGILQEIIANDSTKIVTLGSELWNFSQSTLVPIFQISSSIVASIPIFQATAGIKIGEGTFIGTVSDTNLIQLISDTVIVNGSLQSGNITIFSPTPILVFKDSDSLGANSVGFIEWRDSGGGRAGFFGNNTAGDDGLFWKNEQGGDIGIQTTGAGKFQVFANAVIDGDILLTDGGFIGVTGDTTLVEFAAGVVTVSGDLIVDTSVFVVDSGNDRIGIGVASPLVKVHIAGGDNKDTGPILTFIGNAANQVESGRIRFQESSDYQGAYLHYDGATNLLHIGMHNTSDMLTANDVDVITITRNTSLVTFANDVLLEDGDFKCVGLATIQSGNMSLLLGADISANTRTDATRKFARLGVPHWLNAEEPIGVFAVDSEVATSILHIGGGSSTFNAVTQILFKTAADNTTTTGTTRMSISSTGAVVIAGDTYWTGDGSGLPYGSVWGNEIDWVQTNAAQDTWYEISDANITTGQLNEVTHDGNGQLTIGIAGRYHCIWSVTSEVTAANQHIQITFSVNGTEISDGMNHYESFGVSRQFPISGNAILDLAATDTLEVSIRTTDAGTPDISVDHYNISINQIGGT